MANAVMVTAMLAVTLAAFGIVGRMDYEEALRAEAARQSARAEAAEQAVVGCLNGHAAWLYDNGTGEGHGTTLVSCAGVVEMRL